MALKIRYNAPVTLTFSLICTLVIVMDQYLGTELGKTYFVVYGKNFFNWGDKTEWFHLISHVFGHRDWDHLLGNLAYILLLGPILEERFGSFRFGVMILLTALLTGVISVICCASGLMGASGIVFMMITLISIVNIRRHEIPLTLILMAGLYLIREIVDLFNDDSVSQVAHISGGVMGIILGFMIPPKRVASAGRSGGGQSDISSKGEGKAQARAKEVARY